MTETPRQIPPPQGQGGQEAMWYYAVNGQQTGPVPERQIAAWLAEGRISPHTPLWRQGMAQWLPASQIEGLAPAPGSFPPPMAAPPAPAPGPVDKKVRNAKQNCIAMFLIFALGVLGVLSVFVTSFTRPGVAAASAAGGCLLWTSPVAALFAAIYLPLRWRVIMSLPAVYRRLGLIGGFGLIGMLALVGVAYAIGTMG